MNITNTGLVQWCKDRLGQGYIYGAYFDRIITEAYIQAKAEQYPEQYTADYIRRSRKWIGHYAGDCVGLIKSYYWFDGEKIRYGYQGYADVSANGMHNMATVKGAISTMPDIPGLYVHYNGHIGVYIGGGEVIESRGVDYGVVKTKLSARPWTSWGEVPYVDYGRVRNMQKGDKGNDVKLWQARLIQWDKNALPKYGVDGSFGGETVEWTKRFQSKAGLVADGIVGPSTWNAMIDALQGDPAKIIALETRIKALESEVQTKSALVLEANKKIDSARQAINTLKTL